MDNLFVKQIQQMTTKAFQRMNKKKEKILADFLAFVQNEGRRETEEEVIRFVEIVPDGIRFRYLEFEFLLKVRIRTAQKLISVETFQVKDSLVAYPLKALTLIPDVGMTLHSWRSLMLFDEDKQPTDRTVVRDKTRDYYRELMEWVEGADRERR